MSLLVRRGTVCHRASRKNRLLRQSSLIKLRPKHEGIKIRTVSAQKRDVKEMVKLALTLKDMRHDGENATPESSKVTHKELLSGKKKLQVAVGERIGLCARSSVHLETGMASYGSIGYQMQDATREASGICEFVYKALKILSRTVGTTVILSLLLLVPFLMFIMGVQYLHECPLEPHIPIYLLVGGCFGFLKFLWLLCRQVRSRRYEHIDDAFAEDGLEEVFSSSSYKATDIALTLFLFVWFILGNLWVAKIYEPNYEASLYQPNDWCSKTVFWFTVVQLIIGHVVLALFILLCFCLCCGQRCVSFVEDSYK